MHDQSYSAKDTRGAFCATQIVVQNVHKYKTRKPPFSETMVPYQGCSNTKVSTMMAAAAGVILVHTNSFVTTATSFDWDFRIGFILVSSHVHLCVCFVQTKNMK